jgi:phenolic acid decarboxylase
VVTRLGKHIICAYANGWLYEMCFKNERTIDCRVHGGIVGGRWVKGQEVHIVRMKLVGHCKSRTESLDA